MYLSFPCSSLRLIWLYNTAIMLDYLSLIHQYYPLGEKSYKIFLIHAVLVTNKALKIATKLQLNQEQLTFIEEAAMLHDIGVIKVQCKKMACQGTLPYIAHGLAGAEILRQEGLPRHALVAERHVGVGLTKKEIIDRNLPLPPQDYLPLSIEEKIITYADLFFSKRESTLWHEDQPADIMAELKTFGQDQVAIFQAWQKEFER